MPTGRLRGDPLRSRCEFREANARCVFVDGHPGCHICIQPHGSMVPIRGEGEIPDPVQLWRPEKTIPTGSGASGENTEGLWTEGMIRTLVAEITAAGAEAPRDWNANLPRLRAESTRP